MGAFAKKIRYSGPLKESLREECRLLDISFHIPERNVATRWNSTVVMMNSIASLREATDNLCDHQPALRQYKLTDEEWTIIGQLQPVLNGFLDATKIISESNKCLVSEVIPLIDNLHAWLVEVADAENLHKTVRHAAQRGIAVMDKYYSLTDESNVARFALRKFFLFLSVCMLY
ncbi:hypothetical protein BOTBODRAFT_122407 [Botryobasidium botryosum FD-172 SS1]|uniref:Uncharacterized protein n=1 Tax=Botryobasidium botryosum (strain FD-172 SS1) TaxID=930990 RepID=A0A067LR21_BOTB1|nr:hypothetical protein BOTBODRAFT_122407 [Botryobasidium botryosum FD-172 SS1]